MPDISIILTVYNGSGYLAEQLESLRAQTRQPDEVLILDDGSSDGSPEMVRRYIEEHGLDRWKLVVNAENKGWKRNFFEGFAMASGDLIFPCDQDDRWMPDKCRVMEEIMEAHPEISLLVSGYRIFYSDKDDAKNSYGRGIKADGTLEPVPFNEKWAYIQRPGCTYCFRKTFFDRLKDGWDTYYPHDAILWRMACMEHSLYIINRPLIDFRRHGDNVTSEFVWTRQNRLETLDDYEYFYRKALETARDGKERRMLEKGIEWLGTRRRLLEKRSIPSFLRLMTGFGKYYLSLRGPVMDLLLAFR